jgi:hypothetical protein
MKSLNWYPILLFTCLSLIALILFSSKVHAVTGENARFDWVLGQPAVTDDATAACTNTAVARFDWVLGQPSVVFDATATCGAATATAPAGQLRIFNGDIIIRNGQINIR